MSAAALPVAVFAESAAVASLVRSTTSTLPLSLRASARADGAIHLVDGRSPAWPASVASALARRAAGVLVVEPSLPDETDELPLRATAPIVLDLPWAGSPGLGLLRLGMHAPVRAVTVSAVVPPDQPESLAEAAVDALATVERVLGRVPRLSALRRDDRWLAASGRVADAVFRLSIAASAAQSQRAELTVHEEGRTWRIRLPDGRTAEPALVSLTDAEGRRVLPTEYESTLRAGLRRLVESVRRGEPTGDAIAYASAVRAITTRTPS